MIGKEVEVRRGVDMDIIDVPKETSLFHVGGMDVN